MAGFGFDAGIAPKSLHDLLHNRQTDAGRGGIGWMEPVEHAKNAVMVAAFDANAIVFNPQAHAAGAVIRTKANNRWFALGNKPEGVFKQFDERSLQERWVHTHSGQGIRHDYFGMAGAQ